MALDGIVLIVNGDDFGASAGVNRAIAAALTDYAGICGRLLAKGHARTSGASVARMTMMEPPASISLALINSGLSSEFQRN